MSKPDKAQIKAELWYRGNLSYKLHAGQKVIDEAFRSVTGQLFVANIARQFGKSYWAVCKAIEQALKKPNSRIKYGTAYQSDLLESILPKFAEVLQDCPDSIRPIYKVQGSKWVFKNGSEIKLLGCDKNPNALRGNVIDLIVLDEAGFIDNLEYLYSSIIVPATTHRPNCKIIMISTPPEQATAHPFNDFITQAVDQGAYARLTIYDNPLLKTADIERLAKESGGINSVTFRREYLCEMVVDATRAIIPEWGGDVSSFTVIKQPHPLPLFYKPIVTIDLGLNDNTGVLFGYWDFQRARAVIQAELLLNGVNSQELTEKCRKIEHALWGDPLDEKNPGKTPFRYADGQLYTLNDISTVHGYTVFPVRKDVLEAQVNSLRLALNARQVEIYATCKQLIRQCETGTWDKTKTKFSRSGSCHQDLLAAAIYFIRHVSKENPFPKNFGFDPHTMWRPAHQENSSHEQLKKVFTPSAKLKGI